MLAAIVLAGGRARRLGGIHKPGLMVGGTPLLERVLAAVEEADPRVVVGPAQPVPDGVRLTREDPAGGGPVAALAAGLRLVPEGAGVAVLAGDLPFLTPDVVADLRSAAAGRDGATLVDDGGRPQLLVAVYDNGALREALAAVGDPTGVSMRRLTDGLDLARVSVSTGSPGPPPWFDCDAPGDVSAARAWANDGPRA